MRAKILSAWLRVGLAAISSFVLVSCGPAKSQSSEVQSWFPWVKEEPINILKTESGDDIPERVANFLDSAEQFGQGVQTYRLGSYKPSVTDCSGFLGQAHRAAGHRISVYQFDYDILNFAGCTGQLRAGDVLLLAYPGRQPDHWVMMADVRDPSGKFNSPDNIIMDVSSDYVDGKPFYKGPLSRRKNLLARTVYACRRHRSFEHDWKQMLVQLKEQAQQQKEQTREPKAEDKNVPIDNTPSTEKASGGSAVGQNGIRRF